MFLQLLVYGLQLGSVYALLAIGYTMVYGIVNMINFAHGDFLMVGAFVCYFLLSAFPELPVLPVIIGVILVAAIISGLIGVATERIAYKPLRDKARLSALITAIGVSMFLENFPRALPFIGPDPRLFPTLFPLVTYKIGEAQITSLQILMITISAVLMLGLHIFTTKTSPGKQMRAVAQDKDASYLMGINVNVIISLTFFIGASLAAVSGILYSNIYPMINVYMGSWLGTKSFICAVMGGIGDIRGAMLGGFLLGIIEILATYINADLGYGIAFVLLIFVLLFMPQGLIGKKTIEKV